MQICLCIDLILTLSRPFASKEARMPTYIFCSVFHGLVQTIALPMSISSPTWFWIAKVDTIVFVLSSWAIAIFSITYGVCKLCKPSIAKRVRRLIMVRHVTTIIFFLCTEFYI